jgi:hypothetical protein
MLVKNGQKWVKMGGFWSRDVRCLSGGIVVLMVLMVFDGFWEKYQGNKLEIS